MKERTLCKVCGERLTIKTHKKCKDGLTRWGTKCYLCSHPKEYWERKKNNPKTKIGFRNQNWKNNGINLTVDGYEELFNKQKGVCAICGNPEILKRRLSVDHNHNTGEIRGLLCSKCNLALGWMEMFSDYKSFLEKVSKYLHT